MGKVCSHTQSTKSLILVSQNYLLLGLHPIMCKPVCYIWKMDTYDVNHDLCFCYFITYLLHLYAQYWIIFIRYERKVPLLNLKQNCFSLLNRDQFFHHNFSVRLYQCTNKIYWTGAVKFFFALLCKILAANW